MCFVAVRSFRLWKLKEFKIPESSSKAKCCSSFVPIVETESDVFAAFESNDTRVAVRSFRLWKLKVSAFTL